MLHAHGIDTSKIETFQPYLNNKHNDESEYTITDDDRDIMQRVMEYLNT